MRLILAVALILGATSAYAVDCDSLVVDGGHFLTDVSQVEQSARRLVNQGVTVRVRTFDTVGGKGNMDRHVIGLRDQCRDWQSPDGKGWKSTMLVLAYANEGKQKGVYYGQALQPRVGDGKWTNVLKTALVPLEIAYNAGEKGALNQGFVATLGGLQSLMAAPIGGGGNVTINNTTKTDYSGVWKMFFVLLGMAALIAGSIMVRRYSQKISAAQREAKRVRALCVSGLTELSSQTTEDVLGATIESDTDESRKVVLRRKLAEFKQFVSVASNNLSSFDNLHGNDPNDEWLSVEAYEANKKMYMNIIDRYITPAQYLMEQIKAKEVADPPLTIKRHVNHDGRWDRYMEGVRAVPNPFNHTATATYPPRHEEPKSTVVHHHHDSGVVFVPSPVIIETPSDSRYERSHSWGGGGSLSQSTSSESSSPSSSLSPSSDSGGSYSSYDSGGSADNGGSFASGD